MNSETLAILNESYKLLDIFGKTMLCNKQKGVVVFPEIKETCDKLKKLVESYND